MHYDTSDLRSQVTDPDPTHPPERTLSVFDCGLKVDFHWRVFGYVR